MKSLFKQSFVVSALSLVVGGAGMAQATLRSVSRTSSPLLPREQTQQQRISEVIREFAATLPAMVHQLDTRNASIAYYELSKEKQKEVERLRSAGARPREVMAEQWGWWERDVISTTNWIDSLGTLWRSTSEPARAAWAFSYLDGQFNFSLVPSMIYLTATPAYLPDIERFAHAALTVARQTPNANLAKELNAAGYILTGFVAQERGDTAGAIRAFRSTTQISRVSLSSVAARALHKLVWLRPAPDDTLRLMSLVLQHLLVRDTHPSLRIEADFQLRNSYTEYVKKTKRQPPDVVSEPDSPIMLSSVPLSLDAYLDRQWTLLFDRSFPVIPVTSSVSAPSTRLTVVEYQTGQGCSGCWKEDMALQPLARRYLSDEVVVLAWHGHPPLVARRGRHDWWARFGEWYPSRYAISNHTVVPFKTLLTPSGDTLTGRTTVNGHAIQGRSFPDPESYYRPIIALIDRERSRAPDASLQLNLQAGNDSVRVRVHVDSLRGIHRALALRIVLVADTIWKRGGNNRRMYTNVVQDAAHDDTLSLGLPLRGSLPISVEYAFDLSAIQAARNIDRDESLVIDSTNLANVSWRLNFPDPRDWLLDRNRLFVVAFVQDLDTGDVLHAIRTRVPATVLCK
jgi:hypothetical protein